MDNSPLADLSFKILCINLWLVLLCVCVCCGMYCEGLLLLSVSGPVCWPCSVHHFSPCSRLLWTAVPPPPHSDKKHLPLDHTLEQSSLCLLEIQFPIFPGHFKMLSLAPVVSNGRWTRVPVFALCVLYFPCGEYVCLYRDQRLTLSIFLNYSTLDISKKSLSMTMEFTNLTGLAHRWALEILLSASPALEGQSIHHHTELFEKPAF